MSPLWSVFFPPQYVRCLILVSKEVEPLWDYEVWSQSVAPILDRMLFDRLPEQPSVHPGQGIKNTSREVRFGRVPWSDKGHQKWCHNSPLTKGKCDEWVFVDTEVFYPKRSVLIQANDLPQVYIQVKSLNLLGNPAKIYDSALHLVILKSFLREHHIDLEVLVRALAKNVEVVAIYRRRSRIGSLNAFESLLPEDFIYRGMDQDSLPDPTRTKKGWQRVDKDLLSSSNNASW